LDEATERQGGWVMAIEKQKREQVSKRTRFEIFKRDYFTCQYCGKTPPKVVLHIDHILPVSKGGKSDRGNLITSCADCNLGKSNILLSSLPEPLAEQITEQRERLEQVQAFNKFLAKSRKQSLADCMEVRSLWESACRDFKWDGWPSSRDRSVCVFLSHLSLHHVLNAADIAISRKEPSNWSTEDNCWKYFCGICWKKIKEDHNDGG
jgi:hypothetical protein